MESGWEQWRISPLKSLVLPAGLTLIAVLEGTSALANPSGAEVIHGSATFEHAGSVLSVTNTDGAIIEWQSFNIGVDETTRFNQSSTSSRVLNRVLGSDPSSILGNLTSNGKVFLINPSGILVGEGAKIDVGSLVASTLNISNDDFLSGNYQFDAGQQAGTIVNDGVIVSGEDGSVYLLASDVTNSGIIASPEGELLLAAGHSIKIGNTATPGVSAEITAPTGTVLNLGELLAQQGAISAVAGQLDNQGVINADGLVSDGGKVYLRANGNMQLSGSISANGVQGGQIDATAPELSLVAAHLSADGDQQGGRIRLGGEYQGGKHLDVDELSNAQNLQVDGQSNISVRGLSDTSDGGQAVVWADQQTWMAGGIDARGGEAGIGGKIEVSGAETLLFRGEVQAGRGGEVLFDPKNITIEIGPTSGSGSLFSENAGGDRTMTPGDLTTILDGGTDLILQANNDIKVEDDISVSASGSGGDLTLQAGRSVFLNANIDTDGGALAIGANEPLAAGVQDAHRDAGLAMITMAGSTSISTGGGDIDIKIHDGAGLTNSGAGAITLEQVTGGQIVVENKGADGDIGLNDTLTSTGDIIIDAGVGDFFNNEGSNDVFSATGRWLVYSTDPASDIRGGLEPAFKQYNATSASTLASGGDGLIYSIAPVITPQLIGSVNKAYNGNTGVTLTAANISLTGAIDSDDVGLNAPTSSAFAAPDVGTTLVNAFGFSLSGASYDTPGPTIPVFGYQLATTSASGNIGSISPITLTATAFGQDKNYDGLTDAQVVFTDNRIGGDSLSFNFNADFASSDVGTNINVNVLSISLSGADAGNYVLASTTATTQADILPANLTLPGLAALDKVYDATRDATLTGTTLSGVVAGDSVAVDVSGQFVTSTVGVAKDVTVSGLLSGPDSGNYLLDLSGVILNADVTPATVSLSGFTADNKVYDGDTDTTLQFGTLSGVLVDSGGFLDAVSVSGTGSFDDKNVGTAKTVTAALVLGGSDSGNYQLADSAPTTVADITPASVRVIGVSASDKDYDGNNQAQAAAGPPSGVIAGDDINVLVDATFSDKQAGTNKTVTVNLSLGGADAPNYVLQDLQFEDLADINPLSVTLDSVSATDKVYDGTTSAQATAGNLQGVLAGDDVSVQLNASFDSKQVGDDKPVTADVTLAGADAGNYLLTGSTLLTSASITPLSVTLASFDADNKIYDGTTDVNFTLGGLQGGLIGDDLSVSAVASFDNKLVGEDKLVTASLTLGGADAENYLLSETVVTDNADITAAMLTLAGVTVDDKIYDGNTSAVLGSDPLVGVIAGDDVGFSLSGQFADANVGVDKVVPVDVLLNGIDAGNYQLLQSQFQPMATISSAALSFSGVQAVDKVYDGNTLAATNGGSLTGIIGDDTVSLQLSASFADSHVGDDKMVTVLASLAGADAGNYLLDATQAVSSANITPATLSVTGLLALDKTYDGTVAAQTSGGALIGVVAGDDVSFTSQSTFADKNAGQDKTVTSTLQLAGADSTNYQLDATESLDQADILPATLTLASVSASDRIYDGSVNVQVQAGELQGGLAGDDIELSLQGSFADKNVGVDKTVTTAVSLAGGDAANYLLAEDMFTSSASISPAQLTLTGVSAEDKIYDGTADVQVLSDPLSGGVAGDDLALQLVSSFDDRNVGVDKIVSVSAQLIGGDSANYQLLDADQTTKADVTPATISLASFDASNRTYNGSAQVDVELGEVQGIVPGDDVQVSALGMLEDKQVGADREVSIELTLEGGDAPNYIINDTLPTSQVSIMSAPISLSSLDAQDKVFDGGTEATLLLGALEGVVDGDDVSLSASGAFEDANIGVAKPVNATLALLGADASNYSFTAPDNPTADIFALEMQTWIGSSDGDWSDPGNWQNGVVPVGDNVLALTLPQGVTINYDIDDFTVLESITGGGSLRVSMGSFQLGTESTHLSQLGTLTIDNGSFLGIGELQAALELNGGQLNGDGWRLVGDMNHNGGVFSPGASPGVVNISGDYRMMTGALLHMEIAGTVPESGYDILNVGGVVQLGGTLQLTHLDGFSPQDNTIYPGLISANVSLSGDFDSVIQPEGINYQKLLSSSGLDLAFGVPVIEVVADVDASLLYDVDGILVDEGILVGTSLFSIRIINSLDAGDGGSGGDDGRVGGEAGHFGGSSTDAGQDGEGKPNDC